MREQAFLNAGVRIVIRDERPDPTDPEWQPREERRSVSGGVTEFVEYLNSAKHSLSS